MHPNYELQLPHALVSNTSLWLAAAHLNFITLASDWLYYPVNQTNSLWTNQLGSSPRGGRGLSSPSPITLVSQLVANNLLPAASPPPPGPPSLVDGLQLRCFPDVFAGMKPRGRWAWGPCGLVLAAWCLSACSADARGGTQCGLERLRINVFVVSFLQIMFIS